MNDNRARFFSGRSSAGIAASLLLLTLILSACGSSGDAEEPPPADVGLSVQSGTFTTTVRSNNVTPIPFSETIVVEAVFEEPIYGAAGQTSVFAEVEPIDYRISTRPRRNDSTYTFAVTNRSPGTFTVKLYRDRDSAPVEFSVQVGEE